MYDHQEVSQSEEKIVHSSSKVGIQKGNKNPEFQQELQLKEKSIQRNDTGLPDQLKAGIESLSGHSLDDVKVHYNSSKPAQLNAHAYAQGNQIHLAGGQEKHLAHEAWHVVQQKQGRVRPSLQLKGKVNINDDVSLEKEADVMGRKAISEGIFTNNPLQKKSKQTRNQVSVKQREVSLDKEIIQAKFKRLSEERIKQIQIAHLEKGEELDGDYLEGLYENSLLTEDSLANPELYYKVITVTKAVMNVVKNPLTGERLASTPAALFANVRSEENAKSKEGEIDEDRNMLEILQSDLELWDVNENGPFSVKDVADAKKSLIGEEAGNKFTNDVVGNLLEGGIPEEDSGSYGGIEFRFLREQGDMYVDRAIEDEMKNVLAHIDPKNKHTGINIIPESTTDLEYYKYLYNTANLPYPDLRMGKYFLFVNKDIEDLFIRVIIQPHTTAGIKDLSSKLVAGSVGDLSKPLPDNPQANPKTRKKKYTLSAKRGSRDSGQKAAMDGYSAKEYVNVFNEEQASSQSWEWLHLQGARLGGPNIPQNLVAGTSQANSHMIPYERAIYKLSKFSNLKPLEVYWKATLIKDGDGNNTHIANSIQIEAKFPEGLPETEDGQDPRGLIGLFPVRFNPIEGSEFTKLDRDVVETRGK